MTVTPIASPRPGPVLEELRRRVDRLQGRPAAQPVHTHPALDGLLTMQTGGVYGVDAASLALLLMAGPSARGGWCGVVGAPHLGVEAARELGVDLGRVITVPAPGEHWLEAAAALVDVLDLVVVRPPETPSGAEASRLAARLRRRGAVLVCWGSWPRCDAHLTVTDVRWSGVGQGHGRLTARRAVLTVRRGTVGAAGGPARTRELWLPDAGLAVRAVGEGSDRPGVEAVRGVS